MDCYDCSRPIQVQYIANVAGRQYHPSCVRCNSCLEILEQKCFYAYDKFYCEADYFKKYGRRCSVCQLFIKSNELHMNIDVDKVYHLECFRCSVCAEQLSKGSRFMCLNDQTILCEAHVYPSNDGQKRRLTEDAAIEESKKIRPEETEAPVAESSPEKREDCEHELHKHDEPNEDEDNLTANVTAESNENNGQTSSGRRRGPRTTIKSHQLELLRRVFADTPKPSRAMREQLSSETGLAMRVIQVWFQNRRSKERRLQLAQVNNSRRQWSLRENARRQFDMENGNAVIAGIPPMYNPPPETMMVPTNTLPMDPYFHNDLLNHQQYYIPNGDPVSNNQYGYAPSADQSIYAQQASYPTPHMMMNPNNPSNSYAANDESNFHPDIIGR